MKLTVNIKPTIKTSINKPLVSTFLRTARGYTVNKHGCGISTVNDEFALVNYTKRRKKVIATKRVQKMWNGQLVWTNVRTYAPKQWTAYVYTIPYKVLDTFGIKVIQFSRNFKITKK